MADNNEDEGSDVQMLEALAGEDPELVTLAGPLVAAAEASLGAGAAVVDAEAELQALLAQGIGEAEQHAAHLRSELAECLELANPSGGSRRVLADRLSKLQVRLQALVAWAAE